MPLERKRRAVAAIEALGGTGMLLASQPIAGRTVPDDLVCGGGFLRFTLTKLQRLISTTLRLRMLVLAQLQGVADELGRAWSSKTLRSRDAGLAHLQGLTGLQRLHLSPTLKITDAGLDSLALDDGSAMFDLDITQVTDAGLAHLQGLASLQELSLLFRTQWSPHAGVAHLRKTLPRSAKFMAAVVRWPQWALTLTGGCNLLMLGPPGSTLGRLRSRHRRTSDRTRRRRSTIRHTARN